MVTEAKYFDDLLVAATVVLWFKLLIHHCFPCVVFVGGLPNNVIYAK